MISRVILCGQFHSGYSFSFSVDDEHVNDFVLHKPVSCTFFFPSSSWLHSLHPTIFIPQLAYFLLMFFARAISRVGRAPFARLPGASISRSVSYKPYNFRSCSLAVLTQRPRLASPFSTTMPIFEKQGTGENSVLFHVTMLQQF